MPTGAKAEAFSRGLGVSNAAILTTQQPYVTLFYLQAGITVSALTYFSAVTALAAGNHQYFALYSTSGTRLAISADDGATAWAAQTFKTLSMTTPYQVTTSGLYYAVIMIDAGTVPSLACAGATLSSSATNPGTVAPIVYGNTADAPATTIPNPITFLTTLGTGRPPYFYVT